MRTSAWIGVLVVVGAVSFLAGRLDTSTTARSEARDTILARLADLDRTVAGLRPGVAAAVQRELTRIPTLPASTCTPAEAPPRPEPSAESLAARRDAEQVVVAAIARHHFTEDDNARLRELFRQLPDDAQADVQRQLAVAINSDQLILDLEGQPLL